MSAADYHALKRYLNAENHQRCDSLGRLTGLPQPVYPTHRPNTGEDLKLLQNQATEAARLLEMEWPCRACNVHSSYRAPAGVAVVNNDGTPVCDICGGTRWATDSNTPAIDRLAVPKLHLVPAYTSERINWMLPTKPCEACRASGSIFVAHHLDDPPQRLDCPGCNGTGRLGIIHEWIRPNGPPIDYGFHWVHPSFGAPVIQHGPGLWGTQRPSPDSLSESGMLRDYPCGNNPDYDDDAGWRRISIADSPLKGDAYHPRKAAYLTQGLRLKGRKDRPVVCREPLLSGRGPQQRIDEARKIIRRDQEARILQGA